MKRIIVFLVIVALPVAAFAGKYAKQANDNPFLNGELNEKYAGELTALAGKVVRVKLSGNNKIYELDLNTKGIKNIWVANFIKPEGKSIEIGDEVIFQGYITPASELDPSGGLYETIATHTLLLSIYVKNLSGT